MLLLLFLPRETAAVFPVSSLKKSLGTSGSRPMFVGPRRSGGSLAFMT
jgi:hypothetical protein